MNTPVPIFGVSSWHIAKTCGSPMRVLIVEDDKAAAEYLIKAFGEAGHIAEGAKPGQDQGPPNHELAG